MSARSFSVVYEAGAPNTQVQNLNSGLNLGVGGQVVDQFGRNIYSVVGFTPTDFSTLGTSTGTSLMTSANLGQAGSDDDANLLTLPLGAKVIAVNIIATAAITSGGNAAFSVNVGARNLALGSVDAANTLAPAARFDTVWVLNVTGNTCQVGSVGSLIGATGTSTSGGVPQAGVTSGNQFVSLVNNATAALTAGALQVVVQYVLP